MKISKLPKRGPVKLLQPHQELSVITTASDMLDGAPWKLNVGEYQIELSLDEAKGLAKMVRAVEASDPQQRFGVKLRKPR